MVTADQKGELLARVREHARLDEIVQGSYATVQDGRLRVCAVGCALYEPGDLSPRVIPKVHKAQEARWGIPIWLGVLEDRVFERLPETVAVGWPERFVSALPVGVDLGPAVADRLAVLRLRDELLPLAPTWPDSCRNQVLAAIEQVIAALEAQDDAAAPARSAASGAVAAASRAARSAASARLAEASAESAELAVESAESAVESVESARSAESAELAVESAELARSAESARSAWSAWRWRSTARSPGSTQTSTITSRRRPVMRSGDERHGPPAYGPGGRR